MKYLLLAFAAILFFIAAGAMENGAHWLMQVREERGGGG
jgi:hypothetical protein